MTILSKTFTDLAAALSPGGAFGVVFMQIVPPNLYVLARDQKVDNHLEAWSITP